MSICIVVIYIYFTLQDSTVAVWEYRSPTDVSRKKILDHSGGVWSVDIDEIHIISGSNGAFNTIKVKCRQAGYEC